MGSHTLTMYLDCVLRWPDGGCFTAGSFPLEVHYKVFVMLLNIYVVLLIIYVVLFHAVGSCHPGMARPQVADRGMASDKEGSCELI